MLNRILLFLVLMGWLSDMKSQVQSGTYNLLLKGMLSSAVPAVTVDSAAKMKNVQYVDAREWREFQVSHLPGAVWCGYDDFDIKRLQMLNKQQPVVVYCSIGYRSEKITQKLQAAGYTQVYNLYGGIFEWSNRKKPLLTPKGLPTDTVHAYSRTWGVWLDTEKKVYE